MTKAAIYARLSPRKEGSKRKQNEPSIMLQVERCRHYCGLRDDLEVVEVFDRDVYVSGGTPIEKRPDGAKLCDLISRRRVTNVIILRLDRGFRDAADCLTTVTAWDKKGIALHIVDVGGNTINSKTATGKFILTLMAGAAEWERNLTRERTSEGMKRNQANGLRQSSNTPYGQCSDPDDPEGKRMIEAPEEQDTIEIMLRLAADGMKTRRIATSLNEMGYRNRKGKAWHHEQIKRILVREAPLVAAAQS